MTHDPDKWHVRFLELAEHIAQWSKDPNTKVGAVITLFDRTVLGMGYNGFPRYCDDSEEVYANRDLKLSRVVHAELNAILNSNVSVRGSTLYTTHLPCDRCAAHIIQAGIHEVIAFAPEHDSMMSSNWMSAWKRGLDMFDEVRVSACVYTGRTMPDYLYNGSKVVPAKHYFSHFTPIVASSS